MITIKVTLEENLTEDQTERLMDNIESAVDEYRLHSIDAYDGNEISIARCHWLGKVKQ